MKLGLSLLSLALCLCGQPLTAPRFEVASVKFVTESEVPNSASFSPRRSGNRFTWTATLGQLLPYAFKLPPWRIKGSQLPGRFYSVEALTGEPVGEDEARAMLRQLLVERFKLLSHREMSDAQGYALVAERGGPKAALMGGPLPDYLKGKDPAAFEGSIFRSQEGRNISAVTGRGVTFSRLADLLSAALGASVVDRTGLAGKYYFGFKFREEVADADPNVPTLSTALREELGIRLIREPARIEVLVVDRVERIPTDN